MKYMLILFLFIGSYVNSLAQDQQAKTILDKTLAKMKSFSAVEIAFELTMANKEENIKETYKGKAYMKDSMYRVELMDAINYFDGKTIYTYMPDAKEVTIKYPDEQQEDFLNPAALFNIHNEKFHQKMVENKNGVVHIELTPKEEHKQIEKMDVWVDVNKNVVQKVVSQGKDGNELMIVIQELKQPSLPIDVNFFQFDTKANPDVEVIDLR